MRSRYRVGLVLVTFFFISLACDYRYLYALDLCTMAVLFYLATSRERA